MITPADEQLAREQWPAALSRVAPERLAAVVAGFPADWQVRPKALPQSGLGMLRLRDGALGEDFYLGEFPLSHCWISIRTRSGDEAEGGVWLMDDCQERAEQMALCDAVLSAHLPGWESVAALVAEGVALLKRDAQERKAMLARTRVDFSLLQDARGDQDIGDDDD